MIRTQSKRIKAKEKNELMDELWKMTVHVRDNFTCRDPSCCIFYPPNVTRDGRIEVSDILDAHHVVPKGNGRAVRWLVFNGCTLDRQHHQKCHSFDGNKTELREYHNQLGINESTVKRITRIKKREIWYPYLVDEYYHTAYIILMGLLESYLEKIVEKSEIIDSSQADKILGRYKNWACDCRIIGND